MEESLEGTVNVVCVDRNSIQESTMKANSDKMDPTENVSEEPKEEGKNGILASSFLLTTTVLGAGCVSFPSGFQSTGIVTAIVLIMCCAIVSIMATRMMFMSCHYAEKKCRSYEDVVEYYFGYNKMTAFLARKVVEFTMFFGMSAPSVVYLIVIGDSIVPIVKVFAPDSVEIYTQREFLISVFAVFVMFPFCLLRKVGELKITSIIGVLTVLYVIFMIPIMSIIGMTPAGDAMGMDEVPGPGIETWLNTERYNGIAPVFFMALPTFAFAFGCQTTCVPIYNELKNPKMWKYDAITLLTFLVVTTSYTIVGFFGYFTFGENTAPDVLLNYGAGSIPALIGRFCMGLHCTCAFPITSFVQRSSLNSVLFRRQDTYTSYHIVTTLIIFFGNLLVSLLIPDITVIFGFTVSIFLQFICFLLPGVMCIIIVFKKFRGWGWRICCSILPLFVILVSFGLMIIGPLTSFFKMYSSGRGE